MKGLWDYTGGTGIVGIPVDGEQHSYGDDITQWLGFTWLDEVCGTIEDWGCGTAWASRFVTNGRYTGIDGSPSPWTGVVADLREYTSSPDGIFMRAVLEHNTEWEKILANVMASFRKRFVLVVFTPVREEKEKTGNIAACGLLRPSGTPEALAHPGVPDLSFRREDLTAYFSGCKVREESVVPSDGGYYGPETVFYVEKPGRQRKAPAE